jgi:hypothetical protein
MSENTMNLINAIEAGDAIGMENAFNSSMAEKVAERLDAMRADVAQSMFKTFEQSEEQNTEANASEE